MRERFGGRVLTEGEIRRKWLISSQEREDITSVPEALGEC